MGKIGPFDEDWDEEDNGEDEENNDWNGHYGEDDGLDDEDDELNDEDDELDDEDDEFGDEDENDEQDDGYGDDIKDGYGDEQNNHEGLDEDNNEKDNNKKNKKDQNEELKESVKETKNRARKENLIKKDAKRYGSTIPISMQCVGVCPFCHYHSIYKSKRITDFLIFGVMSQVVGIPSMDTYYCFNKSCSRSYFKNYCCNMQMGLQYDAMFFKKNVRKQIFKFFN